MLLLPAWLLPLVVVAQHLPEWIKVRYPWYIQAFNAGNYLVDLFAAAAVANVLLGADGLVRNDELRFAAAGLAAAAVLVLLNHAILALMLRLARGHSLRESGLFSFESLSTDLVLAALGVLVAYAWTINPALIPFAIAPLLLIHRSLSVPLLEQEARLDPKTGLYNVRYFSAVLNEKLEESLRTERPLALLMIDLDLLREINNTYGHLAGDAILERIADVFRRNLRVDDVAARFGGEEFVLLLPDTELVDALALAERVREAIGRERVTVDAIKETLSATVSIGVAICPRDGSDANTLIHRADLAVFRAKIQGRNRVVDGGAEPLADLLPNTERWMPKPTEQTLDAGASAAIAPGDPVRLDRAVFPGGARRRSALRRPRRGEVGVARRHHADGAGRGRDVRAAAGRHRRAPHARRARGRRPGARLPGRGGRRLGGGRRGARRSRPDRERRSGRARVRSGARGRGDPQAAGLHVDLQPRRADRLGPRSRLRPELRAGERADGPDGRLRRGCRGRLLPRQHEPAHPRDRGRGGKGAPRGLEEELRVAAAALPGLRGRRRDRRDRLRGGARLRPRPLPRAAGADAGDAARDRSAPPGRAQRSAAGRRETRSTGRTSRWRRRTGC